METKLSFNLHVTLVLWTIFMIILVVSGDVSASTYEKNSMCGVRDQICTGCTILATESEVSDIQCARMCECSPLCQGIVLTESKTCYLHYSCEIVTTFTCTQDDDQYRRYQLGPVSLNTCQNGGIWDINTKTCTCPQYFIGDWCERRPRSCRELKDLGYPNGIHWVDMHVMGRPLLTKVKCQLVGSSVRTYISYNNGTSDYNATYQEYKDGFYRHDSSFWLGLDNMHMLTRATSVGVMELLVRGVIVTLEIMNLKVGNECADYQLSFSNYFIPYNALNTYIGNCVQRSVKFSTWDKDQDGLITANLANISGSGWWFDSKTNICNFNGKKPLDSSHSPADIAVPNTDLSYDAYGKDFQSSEFYLREQIP